MCMMEESLKEVTGMVLDKVAKLGTEDKKQFMESPYKIVEEDYDYLRRLRKRVDRVGMELPRIEIRFQNLSVKGEAYVGSRALPTLLNTTLNAVEGVAQMAGLSPSKKRTVNILQDVKGIVKPSRMSLLLGPPGSGKTTLLKALAGRLDNDIKVTGKVTYCGHELSEFVPQKTCAYISKHELHYGQMTVRETLYFSGRCMGAGTRDRILSELLRREKEADIKPNPRTSKEAAAMTFQDTSLITDNILKEGKLDKRTVQQTFGEHYSSLLAFFSTYQMTLSLYRFIAVVGRKLLVANILGFLTMVTVIVLGGFIITKDDIELWMRWGYYLSPIMYGQNAISINEFLDNRWGNLTGNPHESTVGKSLLKERGFFTDEYWYWICVGVLLGLSLIFNILFIAALEFLNAPADSKAMIADDDTENVSTRKLPPSSEGSSSSSEIG
ncbi:ATP-BINDING CASSETTE TRANSPORTER [Salix viminalis]|uniref:ATP-BINDING CASSETTE TRANSPORTER n=1 Tax=Salix viminalis TaxID=40686 RepID=A0A9Q0SBI0_SALVM|nr:ATP-BINDING CASSETTE TRANSPORTER [Salix viminalis]